MRKAAAVQHLRHIASLGLGGRIAVPEMLDTLGHVVPGVFNSFFWITPHGDLVDAYAPSVLLSAFEALVVNYDKLRSAGEPTFDRIISVGPDVGAAGVLHARHDYSGSVISNEVWRPYGIGLGLDLILREGGEAKAILFVNRDVRRSRFTPQEGQALLALREHFLHALSGADTADYEVEDREADVGVMVVSLAGEILSFSGSALQLMFEFLDLPYGPANFSLDRVRELPPVLRHLLLRLQRVRQGQAGRPALLERRTRRGLYCAKAFPLTTAAAEDDDRATLVLARRLPRELGLLRRVAAMELSPRERQLAFHIGLGRGPDAAARAIGVSSATGRGYLKSIYQRLDVQGRAGLVAELQAGRGRA